MRQRHVYPTDQVIHIWAHQTQDSARNGSNVSFDGKLLYSYSTVIAQIEEDKDGNKWAFLSNSSLTSTTGKHVSSSRQATRHMQQFYTPVFGGHWSRSKRTIAEMVEPAISEAVRDAQEAFKPRKRATTKADIVARYERRRAKINEVCAAFGLVDMPAMPDLDPELTAQWSEAAKEQDKQDAERRREQREREREREEKQRQEDAEQFKTWLETGAGRFPSSYRKYGADQITIQGEEVLTSQGARAPLDHVIKALMFYDSRKQEHDGGPTPFNPYHTNGHKIPLGHFTLDSIDEQGNVKAGCHHFTAAEIQRFREQWKEVLEI